MGLVCVRSVSYLPCEITIGGMESRLFTDMDMEPLRPWTSHFLSTSCSTTTTDGGAASALKPENISSRLRTAAAWLLPISEYIYVSPMWIPQIDRYTTPHHHSQYQRLNERERRVTLNRGEITSTWPQVGAPYKAGLARGGSTLTHVISAQLLLLLLQHLLHTNVWRLPRAPSERVKDDSRTKLKVPTVSETFMNRLGRTFQPLV